MKKTILLVMVALIVMAVPAMSAKVVNKPIPHPPILVYQAYCGLTCCDGTITTSGTVGQVGCIDNDVNLGLNGFDGDVIEAVPGILAINPGTNWSNFVSASQAVGIPVGPIPYTVTNVSLRKTVPTYICTVPIGGAAVLQQGSANIRLWWPLMYELPGTTWTLTISYKTAVWDDDGTGPNLPATTHQDVWTWQVDANLAHLVDLIDLFYELPVGSCQVPLINGEYQEFILEIVSEILGLQNPADPNMAELFNELVLFIEDNCLTVDCGSCSGDLGIRNTTENPACCKLLADADYIMEEMGVNIPNK